MPTYDYICLSCGEEHEIFHSMNDVSCRHCPSCDKGLLEKQISGGAGIIFKGTGFYGTDYKPKPSSPEGKPDTSCSHKSACSCSD